ncbi:LLM class flavin-dependent oxidoreductase [Allorhizocola rhizosphaerae]|uniref:LLM class flavin-dependent oxidoreductase n=1 Tax=Allorhizocola rhizosphaerae TaxID=1872709 RepID=UPI0013C34349|nr:LLM class flavin-dependent oxidoreductase [Allorhizocola rhizosphaerae]
MRFSLYSELQLHPGTTAQRLYAEVLEQMVNADRLGYDVYSVIEHFFFPKFSVSANPTALFAAAAQRTQRLRFRTMLHTLPYHNPLVLASAIAVTDILTGGRYEFGVGRGHGWMPPKAGLALDEHARPRYEEAAELLFAALDQQRLSHHGTYFQVTDAQVVPLPDRPLRVTMGGTSDRTYELAAERGWSVGVPPLLPYAALEKQLTLYRTRCAELGTEPDIVWIHAVHLDEDRQTAMREARDWMLKFISGNASPLTEHDKPPADDLARADYGFYTSGILESLEQIPFEQLVEQDYVWVGTPDDIVERIQHVRQQCPGIAEIAITVNAGGAEHWKAIKNQELFARSVIPRLR